MITRKLCTWGKTVWSIFEYIIAPPICYVCKASMWQRVVLCQMCDKQIVPIAPKQFRVTSLYNMTVHAICKYDPPLKSLLLAKHRFDHIALTGLAQLIWEKTVISHLPIDYLIPIPLHWTRKLKRGFNQSELLATGLSVWTKAPVVNALSRIKKTQYQARLEQAERNKNVKKAFAFNDQRVSLKGKNLVLIDDLCTTGSTAVEAAKILAVHKPASITLVVACRAL